MGRELPIWRCGETVVEADKVIKEANLGSDGWAEWHLAGGTVIAASPSLRAMTRGADPRTGFYVFSQAGWSEWWKPFQDFRDSFSKVQS